MYRKVAVTLDGSELAECVLPHVEAIVAGCGAMELVMMRVVEPELMPVGTLTDGGSIFTSEDAERIRREADEKNEAEARSYLEKIKSGLQLDVVPDIEVLKGKPAEAIAGYAENNGVDLVIISTHGRSGISRWAMGSVADRLIRSLCVPVMMVRAPGCVPGI